MATQFGLFGVDKEVHARQPRARLPEQRGQMLMFSEREVLQFGVKAHPQMPLSPTMKLPMLHQDLDQETPEEKEARMQRQAEENTLPMFPPSGSGGDDEPPSEPPSEPNEEPREEPTDFVWPHNGWTNKPTWLIFTWLSSYESTYRLMTEIVNEQPDNYLAARAIEDFLENDMLEETTSKADLACDLMRWALAYVDWQALVKAFKS